MNNNFIQTRSKLEVTGIEYYNNYMMLNIINSYLSEKTPVKLDFFELNKILKDNFLRRLKIEKDEKGKYKIFCQKKKKYKVLKKEEVIRQLFIIYIIEVLNYDISELDVEVPIDMGSDSSKKADIVVYTDNTCTSKYIIIECKKPTETEGIPQLSSYQNATGVKFGAWTNGESIICQLREEDLKTKGEPYKYRDIPRIPKKGEFLKDILKPLSKKDLKPVKNLKDTIERLEEDALSNAGVNAFDELFKLFFAKLYDEMDPKKNDDTPMEFRVPEADPDTVYRIINNLFTKAKNKPGWTDIFDKDENIKLKDDALIKCASTLESIRFNDANLEIIDAAFEYLINPEQKGQKGQYFTPRSVIDLCIKILNPDIDEKIIDPACGSGGFLIHTIKHISNKYNFQKTPEKIYKYANDYVFGIDFDEKLKKVSKLTLLIAGDGKSNIHGCDALDYRKWTKAGLSKKLGEFNKSKQDGLFDIVFSNPPFSGKVSGKEKLSSFELYQYQLQGKLNSDEDEDISEDENKKKSKKNVKSMKRDILFLERCVQLLKPGGRMAVILPQGNFNNIGTQVLREWLMTKGNILGVIGLHENTFKPFTGTKTSVLFFKKSNSEQISNEDYKIFMAVSEKSGKDNSGNYVYLKDKNGNFVNREGNQLEEGEKSVLDEDLHLIVEEFNNFKDEEGFKF